jgi:hypothetical protein
MKISLRHAACAVLATLVAGCAATGSTPARYPRNADEFISSYNWGGWFQNVERMTVERPSPTVVASLREYAKQCLDIKVNKKRAARYALDKYGNKPGSEPVTYNSRIAPIKNGAMALSVQESGAMKDESDLPPGGMFTMVAEVRSSGKNKTDVSIYHLAKPFLANPLKGWIAGDQRDCPAL